MCQVGKGRHDELELCVVPKVPTYVIRYEDLHRDPAGTMKHMLEQTGIGPSLRLSQEKVRR